jgi:hypothetical protein
MILLGTVKIPLAEDEIFQEGAGGVDQAFLGKGICTAVHFQKEGTRAHTAAEGTKTYEHQVDRAKFRN